MRIIKCEKTQTYEGKGYKRICTHCGSELEIEDSDCHIGAYGYWYFTCPCCGKEVNIDRGYDCPELQLTTENLKFPDHFEHTKYQSNNHIVDINNLEVVKEINMLIESIRNSDDPDDYFMYSSLSNLFLLVHKLQDIEAYYVMVTKDFYETEIPFQPDDF